MPNIKSAKKRVKVNEVKALQNKMIKTALKTSVKKADVAIASSSADKADSYKAAVKSLDKAVAKGILHKNTASRKKSQLTKALNTTNA